MRVSGRGGVFNIPSDASSAFFATRSAIPCDPMSVKGSTSLKESTATNTYDATSIWPQAKRAVAVANTTANTTWISIV